MYLNTLKPAPGSKRKKHRVGRGVGCGNGKTCGRGHKGQHARAGGFHKVGFEGGQMPLQRRLPKFGFTSRQAKYRTEVRLNELARLADGKIDLEALKAANIINHTIRDVKIIATGKLEKAIHIAGIKVTQGALAAIQAAGGTVE